MLTVEALRLVCQVRLCLQGHKENITACNFCFQNEQTGFRMLGLKSLSPNCDLWKKVLVRERHCRRVVIQNDMLKSIWERKKRTHIEITAFQNQTLNTLLTFQNCVTDASCSTFSYSGPPVTNGMNVMISYVKL